ncbi:hypothetical protein [Planctomyces sp. SH-PL62]|nr:hypothetical protein [Planctomyces sp. SH-PL62]
MNARNNLSVACLNGGLVLAAIVGAAGQSWPAFLAAFAAGGDIRFRPGRR